MTIGFSENMEFTGRSVDPEGRPAAMADFHGIVTAQMEDALLHCTEKMIAFTDREVPLTQLGKMTQEQSQSKPGDDDSREAGWRGQTQAELTLHLLLSQGRRHQSQGRSRPPGPDPAAEDRSG